MNQHIELTALDGHHFSAYQSTPPNAKGAVVILQEIFGVNQHIRSVADTYAKEGFFAITPALFDRVKKGVELGYSPESIQQAREIASQLKREDVLNDIAATLDYARNQVSTRKVGVVGYCMGGSYAWLSATRLTSDASVSYYGSLVAPFIQEEPRCPVQFHFGKQDHAIPLSDVEKIQQHRPNLPLYLYEAGHGFNCDERASFSAEAASQALDRSLTFLKEIILTETK